mmetsp:Transcript_69251/g.129290  ORF Transcript_69251/g.129290 Transcript_69251/m.129290 type:complete len:204 (-) Transcript_69251:142-753(-)
MFDWLWAPDPRQEPAFSLGPTAGRPPSIPQTGPRYDMAEPRGYPSPQREQREVRKSMYQKAVCGFGYSEDHHQGGPRGETHQLVPAKPGQPTSRYQGPLYRGVGGMESRFEEAQREAVRRLTEANSNEERALIYGYYMQAKYGDCKETQPSGSLEIMQWKEWLRHNGMSKESAMERYVYAVECVTNFTITPAGQTVDPVNGHS